MLKKSVTLIIVVLLINFVSAAPAMALDKLSKEAKHTAKVKAGIAKLGTGKDAKINVKLKDGTKLKGYVSEISEDSFTVTDHETGKATVVPYPNAKQVRGNGLSDNQVLLITFGALIAVTVITAIVKSGTDDTFGGGFMK